MTGIDKASAVAESLRLQMSNAQRARAGDAKAVPGKVLEAASRVGKGGATTAGSQMNEALLSRIKAIDAADPDRRRKAFRLFMESVMLTEFGEHMRADPQFSVLLDSVVQQMDSDPELYIASSAAMNALFEEER